MKHSTGTSALPRAGAGPLRLPACGHDAGDGALPSALTSVTFPAWVPVGLSQRPPRWPCWVCAPLGSQPPAKTFREAVPFLGVKQRHQQTPWRL